MNTRRMLAGGALALTVLLGAGSSAQAQPPTLGETPRPPAQPVDPALKATARAAAEAGLKEFDAGRYQAALDKFESADKLVHAPTMGLMAARSLEKLGRLVEASERFLATSRLTLEPDASAAFKSAIASAEKEHKALLPRLGKVVIGLRGAAAGEVELTLDGKAVPSAIVGIERLTDPGHHTLRGKRGAQLALREIDLKEGETLEVALELKDGGTPAGGSEPGSVQRALGWTAVGVGVAGVVVGTVTVGLRVSLHNTLFNTDGCTQALCPDSAKGDVDRFNALKPWPIVGYTIGGAGLVAGIVLLATAPKARPAGGALTFLPWVGPRGAGVTGVF